MSKFNQRNIIFLKIKLAVIKNIYICAIRGNEELKHIAIVNECTCICINT